MVEKGENMGERVLKQLLDTRGTVEHYTLSLQASNKVFRAAREPNDYHNYDESLRGFTLAVKQVLPEFEVPQLSSLTRRNGSLASEKPEQLEVPGLSNPTHESNDAYLGISSPETGVKTEKQRLIDSIARLTLRLVEKPLVADRNTLEYRVSATEKFTIIEDFCRENGLYTERIPFADDEENTYALLVGTHSFENDLSQFNSAFVGNHIDVVHGGPPIRRQGNIYYARGAADLNGPNAVILHILKNLAELATKDASIPPALALFGSNEEFGSPGYAKLVERLAQRELNPQHFICFDGAPEGTIETAEKGCHTVTVTLRLPKGIAHSAHAPYVGGNPIELATGAILKLRREIGDPRKIASTTVGSTVNNSGNVNAPRTVPDDFEGAIDIRSVKLSDLKRIPRRLEELLNSEIRREIRKLEKLLRKRKYRETGLFYEKDIHATIAALKAELTRTKVEKLPGSYVEPSFFQETPFFNRVIQTFQSHGIHLIKHVARGLSEARFWDAKKFPDASIIVLGLPGTHNIHGTEEYIDLEPAPNVIDSFIEILSTRK